LIPLCYVTKFRWFCFHFSNPTYNRDYEFGYRYDKSGNERKNYYKGKDDWEQPENKDAFKI